MAKVRFMALGGLDENGKNMYTVEINGDIFVIEAGLKYPDESEQLGIEYIIPDFTYLKENKDRVKAIFISHGHDDVMMGLVHLAKEIDVPIYASALTARIITEEFEKRDMKNRVNVIKRKDTINIDGHIIHTFPVMQSIPDGFGLAFDSEDGSIVYSSEFIIDSEGKDKAFNSNLSELAETGKRGVLALLSESIGADKEGYTAPKHRIGELIEHYFEVIDGRIIISLYKQNLFRIIEILEMAKQYNRKVYFYDQSHIRLLKNVEALGYYKIPYGLIVDNKDFTNDMKDVVCVISGSGEDVFKIVSKIAIGEDDCIELDSDDTVIIASPVVPGTEKEATDMENDLYKADVRVIKFSSKQILSMHASKEDLKMMLYFIRPKYYIPIKGEYKSLIDNADIAVDVGYTPDKIVILDNGQFAEFDDGKLVSTRDIIELNDTLIDASDKTDVSGMVLKDREALSTEGVIVIGVVLDFNTKELIGGPDVQSRGVIYLKDADHILNEIGLILVNKIKELVADGRYENMQARLEAREEITKFILKETGKKPVILPSIVELNLGEE